MGAGLIGWSAGQLAYSDPWMPDQMTVSFGEKGEQWSALLATGLVLSGGLVRRRIKLKQRGPSGSSLAS